MKLALGTVQFGLDYGVTNTQGQVPSQEVGKILDLAEQVGIDLLDTAALYGNSEQVLGTLHSGRFRIVTKLTPHIPEQGSIADILQQSLDRLQCDKVDSILLHSADDLLAPKADQLYKELDQLKQDGRVAHIGISVYHPLQARLCTERYALDLIQLPFSALDQRFAESGTLELLKSKKMEIHARSLFLQGLLLGDSNGVPAKLVPYRSVLDCYYQQRAAQNASPLEFALGICHQQPLIDRFIIGCCSRYQLQQIVTAYHNIHLKNLDYQALSCNDERLIIPSNW